MSASAGGQRLPLFPLNTVLFPEGMLPLRVFEPRYMDMVTRCMREGSAFGVCLIAAGEEVGEAAVPHPVGTAAHIEQWDMEQAGLLTLLTRGGRRFRVVDHEVERDGLLVAEVCWLPEPAPQPVPTAQLDLLPLLQTIVAELGERLPPPHRFDDAGWVGARYAELLPVPLQARQRLLELDDVVSRLEILQQFLREHGLLPRIA
ncbi:LON peptidase substrate-binding domain-containing protein [Thauera linaloolentis]|uniref:Peptidase S16 n=1 Tax=Thauera linaloolentis (strain DSM 12138 / JCM 21573 / CCUG 41526 / CIP 105981 / IAM 15112 / NBRC 102519 / 47Lol) TaxID=1123367 RepID=N6Z1U2_THAL4|nr:LON peptidase substrate-binding domain-containing protein [Thauera linaloolentis]ENO86134.1 peptidase S16 [Thauera linaloolentis 47Lol = DSM 12138]MCM8564637.1 LON peptidase substrate-binding domain-containing protein [Thauera linaloolentis]